MKQNLNCMRKKKHLQMKIEGLRGKMYDTNFINGYPLDNKTIQASKDLDEVISEYMKIRE